MNDLSFGAGTLMERGENAPDEPLAQTARTLLEQARSIASVQSLAIFVARDGGQPQLAASAGDGGPEAILEMEAAARTRFSGKGRGPSGGAWCGAVCDGADRRVVVSYFLDNPHADDHEALSLLADSAARQALLEEKLAETKRENQNRLQRLSALYEIGQTIHTKPAQDLLDLICEKATAVMEAQACSLLLRNEQNELVIRASHGLLPEVVRETRLERGQGIAWHVAATGQPMLLNESPSQQIGDLSISDRPDIQSSMCVPLRGHDGRILGVLSIRRMVPAPRFDEEDLKLFCVFADQAALNISNSDLYASLSRRVHEMSTVNRLTAAINSTLDLEYVLAQIADCIIDVVGFDRCGVYLSDYRDRHLDLKTARGMSDGQYPERIDPGEGVVGLAVREQIVIFAEGEALATASQVSDPESAGGNALIAAPIVVQRRTIGVIVADNHNTGRHVDHSQVELLSTFVNHAGLAIENSSLYEAMEQKYSELNVLYDLSRTIGSAYGLDNAVDLLLEVALKAVPYSSAAFALVDERLSQASIHAVRNTTPSRKLDWGQMLPQNTTMFLSSLRDPRILAPSLDCERKDLKKAFRPLLQAGYSLLLMPLIADGAVVGVLMLARPQAEVFESDDVKLLSIIGAHAGVVIKNAATYEQSVREKVLELSALYDLAQRISTAGSTAEALDSILAIVGDLVQCDECMLWTVNQESGELELQSSLWGGRSGKADRDQPATDDALAAWAIQERKAVVLPDIRKDTRFVSAGSGSSRVRSVMSIPLMVQDEVVGVLNVHSYAPNAYTEEQVRTLSVVASQAASIYRGLEALTALTSYTDNILTSVAAGVATLDADGSVVSWNRAAEEILHLPQRKALGKDLFRALREAGTEERDMDALAQAISRVNAAGTSERGVRIAARDSGGADLHLMLSVAPLRDQEGEPLGLVLIFEDITRQVEMQEEMRRMGELAAIGQLAASIAHELRNPLSSIKGAAQFLQTETEDPATREFLGIILEEVDGLNKIASEFLDFARPLKVEPEDVSVEDIIQKQVALLGQAPVASVDISCDCEDGLPAIQADRKQVEQVLLNIVLNAIQAMPDGGSLQIAARRSQRWNDHVEITVRDSGSGMSQDRMGKIFTPFFTTKIKGTGLGLPVVQKIVQNHCGHIEVDSREGEGTTFRVHLPIEGPRVSVLGDSSYSPPDLLERS